MSRPLPGNVEARAILVPPGGLVIIAVVQSSDTDPPPRFNPMVAEILKLQAAVPFHPFVVTTSSGRSYEVPTPDHITVTRLLRQIEIEEDDGIGATISPFHVTAVERITKAAS
jgi:hypothetical protein